MNNIRKLEVLILVSEECKCQNWYKKIYQLMSSIGDMRTGMNLQTHLTQDLLNQIQKVSPNAFKALSDDGLASFLPRNLNELNTREKMAQAFHSLYSDYAVGSHAKYPVTYLTVDPLMIPKYYEALIASNATFGAGDLASGDNQMLITLPMSIEKIKFFRDKFQL